MAKPNVLVLAGHGINCEEETRRSFENAGAKPDLVHINDLIGNLKNLEDYQILVFPGGFSYGDYIGAGIVLANKIKGHLLDQILNFVEKDKLTIGICNGFQVMTNLGLLSAIDGNYGNQQVALVHNDFPRYSCRWIDLKFEGNSPWTSGIEKMSLPIAHGEGKFYAPPETLAIIKERDLVSARYVSGEMCEYLDLEPNPNGSLEDIAAITDESGRLIGMMPHPERAIDFTQLPNWLLLKEMYKRSRLEIPEDADGLKIFQNGVNYFK